MSINRILSPSAEGNSKRSRSVFTRLAAMLMVAVIATGCVTGEPMNKQTGATIIGAGVGGLAGSQFGNGRGQLAAVTAGALLGALLGAETGRSLDRADQAYIDRAQQQASVKPLGEPIVWSNPESGHSGTVVATREGTTQTSGKLCREYHHTVYVGGEPQEAYGTACREVDGSWTVVN